MDQMKIGIDFDNTIVTYDKVFHRHAVRLGLIPNDVEMSKRKIRDAIRLLPDGESKWTELQGLVYGLYIDEAELAPGVEHFFWNCEKKSATTFIISHKTKYPAKGLQFNLRDAARRWIDQVGLTNKYGVSMTDCFFVGSMAEKLAKISECGCDYFIDDLVEVLCHPDFPGGVKRVLYQVDQVSGSSGAINNFSSWDEINEFIFS